MCAARQLGFADANECPQLCKLAMKYLRNPKGCEQTIYEFFANNDQDVDSLYVMLVEEFERCILTYFAFHWSQASLMISQVLFHNFILCTYISHFLILILFYVHIFLISNK